MERGGETDWRWWCVLFLVQVKTLQNGNGGWALPELSGWSTLHQRILPRRYCVWKGLGFVAAM